MKAAGILFLAILGILYFVPLLVIALYSCAHLFLFGTDFTSTPFVVKFIKPLTHCAKIIQ